MSPIALLVIYCALIVLASLAGGWIPLLLRLDHRRMEILVSFVSGVMLGVAMLHLLPDAWSRQAAWMQASGTPVHFHDVAAPVATWVLIGLLAMFFVERFFCFHHHGVPGEDGPDPDDHGHGHHHKLTWTGATIGLTLHSLIAGVALAAAVGAHADTHTVAPTVAWTAGLGTFLAIVLHKPFDAMTIGALMAVGKRPTRQRHLVNLAFGLAVPAGAVLLLAGVDIGAAETGNGASPALSRALAFAAGTFLCISLSDLLPELQFHQHDRVKLSVALILGLAVAWGAARLEHGAHADGDHFVADPAGHVDHP